MTAQPVPALGLDLDQARRFIERVYADAPGHLSVCAATGSGPMRSEALDTIDDALAAIERFDRIEPQGIYLRTTTLTAKPARGRRGGAEDTRAFTGLWSDLDFGTVGHKPSASGRPLPPTADEAWRIVKESGLPEPSLWVHSGGGLYAWWTLEAPVELDDTNRAAIATLSAQWQQALGRSAERLGYDYGTGVGDLARVLRIPGTINRKAGTERPCVITEDTGQVFVLSDFTDALDRVTPAATASPAAPARRETFPVAPRTGASAFDLLDEHATFTDILTGAGWTLHNGRHGQDVDQCWTRAGNPDHACSAHTLTANPHVLVVFSEAAGLPTGGGQALTRGRVFAHLWHHGDERAAALDLFAAISRRPSTTAAAALPLPRETRNVHTINTVGDLHQLEQAADDQAPTVAPDPADEPFDLERDDFWTARPELEHIRQFARARIASPWATLGVALARVTAHVEPHYVLPPIVGGEVGLNLFIAVTGPSGSGKGAATAAARDAINFGNYATLTEPNVGSGEGIVHTYMARTKAKDGDTAGTEIHTTRALFHAAEVDTLAALKGRQGSTLLPVLRDAWMSDRLGFQNADPTRRLILPPHAYRLSLIVGVQPARANVLLDDADGGTPQRFLWLPSTDPGMPDTRPDEPDAWPWHKPDPRTHITHPGTGRYRTPVCTTAVTAIEQAARARARGETDALDGHALLNQLKTAAALALLAGRANITGDDWHLSETVMTISNHTRAHVQRALTAAARANAEARGHAEAVRTITVNEAVTEHATKRVARTIRRKLTDEWTAHNALRKQVAARDRHHFEDAIERLHTAGDIDIDNTDNGLRYRLAGATK